MTKQKILIFTLVLFSAFLLSGCNNTNNKNYKENNNEQKQEEQKNVDNQEIDPMYSCIDVCETKIPVLCEEEIQDMKDNGTFDSESIYDVDSCQFVCETSWDEELKDCISDADSCSQIVNSEPYCIDDTKPSEKKVDSGDCNDNCQKYAKCAGYADDAVTEDLYYAYESCMEECSHWSQETKDCISKTEINNPADCMPMTICALKEYQGVIER